MPPRPVKPVLTSARTITRTGYMATRVSGSTVWQTLLADIILAAVGGVTATQGTIIIGLTGTIVVPAGLHLIAVLLNLIPRNRPLRNRAKQSPAPPLAALAWN
jgi:hypothetical protein